MAYNTGMDKASTRRTPRLTFPTQAGSGQTMAYHQRRSSFCTSSPLSVA